MAFAGVDFYGLDEELTEEERLVRDNVRRFVENEVVPIIGRHYQAGTFPMDLIPKFADLGLLGANLEGYGCAGMGDVAYGLAMQELERGDSGVRSFCSVQGSLCMYPDPRLRLGGAEAALAARDGAGRADRLLRPHRAGLRLEPDRDDHARRVAARAEAIGSTAPSAGSPTAALADVAVVWAKLDGGKVRGLPGARRARRASARGRSTTSSRCAPASRASSSSRTARSAPTRSCPAWRACAGRCPACLKRDTGSASARSARR